MLLSVLGMAELRFVLMPRPGFETFPGNFCVSFPLQVSHQYGEQFAEQFPPVSHTRTGECLKVLRSKELHLLQLWP